jgi:tRNA dimethylallyltransferase
MSTLEGKDPPPFRVLKIALIRDRTELYRLLDQRVDNQIEAGLLDEVRGLFVMGLSGDEPAFSSIGYRQLVPVLAGALSLADAIVQIKRDTHHYVRHQMTWLRRTSDLHWIDTGAADWQSRVTSLVEHHLMSSGTSEP